VLWLFGGGVERSGAARGSRQRLKRNEGKQERQHFLFFFYF